MNKLKNNFLVDKKIILVDFFDTIVHRNSTPNQIKEKWAKRISIDYDFAIMPEKLYLVRQTVENELESKYGYGYTYIQLISSIWNRLFDADLLCESKEDFYNKSLAIETDIEKESLYLDAELIDLLTEIDKKEKKIYIVSDYHLGESVIRSYLYILRVEEYFDGIFMSCDYNASKYTGTLYDEVLQKIGCTPYDCVMIGDNYYSDMEMSKKKGIDCIYRPFKQHILDVKKNNYYKKLLPLLEKDDFSGYCFSLSLFTEKLFKDLKINGLKKVFFLSREGEFLKKLFDLYCKVNNDYSITSYYLYVSRKSTFVASLCEKLENENFEVLFRQFNDISIEKFLKNIGFNDSDVSIINSELPLDIYSIINSFSESQEFMQLKKIDYFRKRYQEVVLEQKQLLKDYLKQEGYDFRDPLCIVDVGWKGTIQDNIFKVLSESSMVKGYYLGLGEIIDGKRNPKNRKKGILFSIVPYQSMKDRLWAIDAGFFEKILYASHPSIFGYQKVNGEIWPIFKSFEEEKGVFDSFIPIQNKIYEKCNLIFNTFSSTCYLLERFEKELLYLHLQSILTMNRNKIMFRKNVEERHFENFGTFDTVRVGNISKDFNLTKNYRYFISRLKKLLNPTYFIRNSYHFVKIKSKLFWMIYSNLIKFRTKYMIDSGFKEL